MEKRFALLTPALSSLWEEREKRGAVSRCAQMSAEDDSQQWKPDNYKTTARTKPLAPV